MFFRGRTTIWPENSIISFITNKAKLEIIPYQEQIVKNFTKRIYLYKKKNIFKNEICLNNLFFIYSYIPNIHKK